jgi:hypothetical protein
MNKYIEERDGKWVVLNKQGDVISTHDSKAKAKASFRGMEWSKHRFGHRS